MTNRIIFDSSSARLQLPKTPESISLDYLYELISYFRVKNNADKHSGYNLCRDINREASKLLAASGFKVFSLSTHSFNQAVRNRGSLSEHFVGVVLIDGFWHYFGGTTDQLKSEIEVEKPVYMSPPFDCVEEIFPEISKVYGCEFGYDSL